MRSLLNFCKYVPHALPKREKTHRGSTPWAKSFCPLPLLYPSASDLRSIPADLI